MNCGRSTDGQPPPVGRTRRAESLYAGETYYQQPPLKASPWNWTVSGYMSLTGMSGAAQALAFVGQRVDPDGYRDATRNARYLSAIGSTIGTGLLILDLRTPQRWFNMLRIFRSTSPMSFGSYILIAFSGLSALSALGELLRERGSVGQIAYRVANAAQPAAAITGAGVATYTASILSATSTPYWAATPWQLGAKFGTSAIATGAAALSLSERLAGRHRTAGRLDCVAALATAAHLGLSLKTDADRQAKGIAGELRTSPDGMMLQASELVVAGLVPLAAYALNRATGDKAPALSVAASVALLLGGWMLRHGTMRLGMRSAEHPQSHFQLAQPRNLPERRVRNNRTSQARMR